MNENKDEKDCEKKNFCRGPEICRFLKSAKKDKIVTCQ